MRRYLTIVFGVLLGLSAAPLHRRCPVDVPAGLRRVRHEPVGGRSRRGNDGRPGSVRAWPGRLRTPESQGRCDQRGDDGEVEQGPAGAPGRAPGREAGRGRQAGGRREQRVEEMELRDGTTLNNLLYQILDSDPKAARTGRVKAPISPAAIREIPFEWDSEAISVCLDQMTGRDSLPPALMQPAFAEEPQCPACRGPARARRGRQGGGRGRDAQAYRRGRARASAPSS